MDYSLVLVDFTPALASKEQDFNSFRFIITPPSSDLHQVKQTLRKELEYRLPTDGKVLLKLMPAEDYYKVDLYHDSQSLKLDTWHWHIPPAKRKITFKINYLGEPLELPFFREELVSVSEEYEITEEDKIDFPNLDSGLVTLTYQPAYTLEEITVEHGPFSTNKGRAHRRYSG